MKKIPYGIINYKTLIEENYIYVDKTMYLEKLEKGEKTIIYLRPGRFGKSLFTSMMYYYYDVNSKELFDTLFKDTYVYNNSTPKKNGYYVLKFDFSGMTTIGMTIEKMEEEFKGCVVTAIERFVSEYKLKYEVDKNMTPNLMLKYFLSKMASLNLPYNIYILIDEYDNFTNGILEGDTSIFKSVVSKNGFVKAFYAVIKEYIGLGIIDRFFATGICPITLNSMTTGFNIATDKSTNPMFNSMIGLTHDEVRNLLCELELSKEEQDSIYDTLIANYDGYLFSIKLGNEDRVFNATLVMYFLKEYISTGEIPVILYDNNIVVNYGKIDNLIKLQNNSFYKELISDILDNGKTEGVLKTQFNLEEDFTRDDIVSLLYYFGYLTIKELNTVGKIDFKIPNYIMKETYGNYFLKILRDNEIHLDTKRIDEGLRELILEGKIEKITTYIGEVLKLTDNRLFINMSERDIELLYFTLLKSDLLNIYTEYPCNGGYADLYIFGKVKPLKYNILVELKYIKKSEYKESILKEKYNEAKLQIEEYSKDERIYNVKKYVVVFVGSEVKLLEEIF